MGMDKTAGRTVARVAVDRGWGALDIVTAAGAGQRARGREPLPGAGSGSWTWGPGRCGVWGWKGAAGQRAPCLGLLGVFSRGVPTGTCRRERSDGEGGSPRSGPSGDHLAHAMGHLLGAGRWGHGGGQRLAHSPRRET